MMRIGHGYDVHRLVPGRDLVLGGVRVPHETGLLGHSDADVLAHAVMDALLGAAALGDIGRHFPDTDESYAGADRLDLLRRVRYMIDREGYSAANIDATIVAEAPKLAQYIPEMCNNLTRAAGLAASQVNIKATTQEGLGLAGKGIAAHAVVLLEEVI